MASVQATALADGKKLPKNQVPKVQLSHVLKDATPEEKKMAKDVINSMDFKKKKSSLSCMMHFIALNPDDQAKNSRGKNVRSITKLW